MLWSCCACLRNDSSPCVSEMTWESPNAMLQMSHLCEPLSCHPWTAPGCAGPGPGQGLSQPRCKVRLEARWQPSSRCSDSITTLTVCCWAIPGLMLRWAGVKQLATWALSSFPGHPILLCPRLVPVHSWPRAAPSCSVRRGRGCLGARRAHVQRSCVSYNTKWVRLSSLVLRTSGIYNIYPYS